jgi:hypothetical protein
MEEDTKLSFLENILFGEEKISSYLESTFSKDDGSRYILKVYPHMISNHGELYGEAMLEKKVKREAGNNWLSRKIAKHFPEKTEWWISNLMKRQEPVDGRDVIKIEPDLYTIREVIKQAAEKQEIMIDEYMFSTVADGMSDIVKRTYQQISSNPTYR